MEQSLKRDRDVAVAQEEQPTLKVAREDSPLELINVVDKAAVSKSAHDFPLLCLNIAREKLVGLIDRCSVKNNLVFPQHSADGKKIVKIILLAAACSKFGLDALQTARQEYDMHKLRNGKPATRNWFSFVTDQRYQCYILSTIKTSKWSQVRGFLTEFEELSDSDLDMLDELDDVIVNCFQEHDTFSTTSS
jgi:hypothetical protein